jgi:hypothetical protein
MEELSFEKEEDEVRRAAQDLLHSPAAQGSPRHGGSASQSHPHSPPPAALEFERRSVKFYLGLIADDVLPDVEHGLPMDSETIRELHDVRVPEVHRVIKECRDAVGKYANRHGCDSALVKRAQLQCERAYEWTRQVVARYRGEQHHLAGNVPARDITFVQFDPSGEVSVYEFFSKYEEWGRGYVSTDAMAHLLFTKYLPKTLTEGYDELRVRKTSYEAMKSWLIDQFGMIRAVCDNQLRILKSLKPPKSEDDLLAYAQYLRKIHRGITTLQGLEVRKGVRVPGLQEHMETNTFLMQLAEVLPKKVQYKWSKFLAESNVTTWKVEGKVYLDKILDILRKAYAKNEIHARIPGNEVKSKAQASHIMRDESPDSITAVSVTSKQLSKCGDSSSTGVKPKNDSASSKAQKKVSRWSCPVEGHEKHELAACFTFFNMTIVQRRTACRGQACWTCLARRDAGGDCKGGKCSRLAEVPTVLLCQDCANSSRGGKAPLNILMCGLDDHVKPSEKMIGEALEKWVPNFKVSGLGAPLVVTLSSVHASSLCKAPPTKSSPPSNTMPTTSFNTSDGSTREISVYDSISIIMPAKEESFFIMQQLRINGEDVLTFFYTGANAHLVEGSLAEKAGFTVLDDRCVSIGVVGGSKIWSEYGQYACVLGPDCNGQFHHIECQGLERITSFVPEFDLSKITPQAASTFPNGNRLFYPKVVGGDCVKLLIGIKSSALVPKLHFSLPNGLGIYISSLIDIYKSNICYGGSHEVFTEGYAKLGTSAGHVQVLFSQVARAYLRSPYMSVHSRSGEYGTPEKSQQLMSCGTLSKDVVEMFCDRGFPAPVPNVVPDCSAAEIPLTKLNALMGEDDGPVIKDSQCAKCANCRTCQLSHKAKTPSLQEVFNQENPNREDQLTAQSGQPYLDETSLTVGCRGLTWAVEHDLFSPSRDRGSLEKKVLGQEPAPEHELSLKVGLMSAYPIDLQISALFCKLLSLVMHILVAVLLLLSITGILVLDGVSMHTVLTALGLESHRARSRLTVVYQKAHKEKGRMKARIKGTKEMVRRTVRLFSVCGHPPWVGVVCVPDQLDGLTISCGCFRALDNLLQRHLLPRILLLLIFQSLDL